MIKTTALLATAALTLGACGGSSYSSKSNGNSGTTTTSSSSKSASSGYGSSASSKPASASNKSKSGSHEVKMYDNYFGPKTISGKPGSTVKIKLKNEGQAQHNFKIDSQLKQADADVKPGATATVSVTIPKSGSLQFYCEYHKALGMTGTVKAS